MNKIKSIVETIIHNEIEPDKAVFNDGYVISPININIALKGDGTPQELTENYQIDFFFKNKGELIAKSKLLIKALGDYPTDDITFTWEETVRLWRATLYIETI